MRIFIILIILAVSNPLQAAENNPEDRISETAVAGLDYLIEFVKPAASSEFDPARLAGLVDFVHTQRPAGSKSQLPERLEATPAYYEFLLSIPAGSCLDPLFQ